jgi:hypothetical protein
MLELAAEIEILFTFWPSLWIVRFLYLFFLPFTPNLSVNLRLIQTVTTLLLTSDLTPWMNYRTATLRMKECLNGRQTIESNINHAQLEHWETDWNAPMSNIGFFLENMSRQKDIPYLERALCELWWGYGGGGGIDR